MAIILNDRNYFKVKPSLTFQWRVSEILPGEIILPNSLPLSWLEYFDVKRLIQKPYMVNFFIKDSELYSPIIMNGPNAPVVPTSTTNSIANAPNAPNA